MEENNKYALYLHRQSGELYALCVYRPERIITIKGETYFLPDEEDQVFGFNVGKREIFRSNTDVDFICIGKLNERQSRLCDEYRRFLLAREFIVKQAKSFDGIRSELSEFKRNRHKAYGCISFEQAQLLFPKLIRELREIEGSYYE